MKRSENFTLEYLHGVPYLLPYGQAVADLRRGLKLNETGAFLWNAMQDAPDFDALFRIAAQHYHADETERKFLSDDLRQFLVLLKAYGMLLPESKNTAEITLPSPEQSDGSATQQTEMVRLNMPDDIPRKLLAIAGLQICFCGNDADFPAEFHSFLQNAPGAGEACRTQADLTLCVLHAPLPKTSEKKLVLTSADLAVYETATGYTLLFPSFQTVEGALLSADGDFVTFYCSDDASCAEELFHAIRFVFLYATQRRGLFAMHSVSVLYRDRLWLFSGHSGMGKSTHAALWEKLYQTPVINGDLNLLTCVGGSIVAEGIPWCGTSGIFDTATYPIGGIFLLKRGQTDYVCDLSEDEQQLLSMQRLISPAWTKAQLLSNLAFADKLRAHVPVMRLVCTKNESAAIACKAWIDAHLPQ